MTLTPHDALFKAAFEAPEHAAGFLRTLLPKPLVDAIAWNTIAADSASFIDPDLAPRHSDLLFSVELSGKPAFLYLLLEHQSTSDADMPLRLLVYLVRIWERVRKRDSESKSTPPKPLPLIVPVIISHAPDGWTAPLSFHDMFDPVPSSVPGLGPLIPNFSTTVEDLRHLSNDDLRARALAAFPTLALWALRDARNKTELLANIGTWRDTFLAALRTPWGAEVVALIFRYLALVSDLGSDEFRGMIQSQLPEAESIAMTLAQQLEDKGRKEGREEGREEGRAQGQAETLIKLLSLKFGELSDDVRTRITSAGSGDLDRFTERVLTADTLDAVFEP